MSHVVESCPLNKLNGGLFQLHSADDAAVAMLTNYGSYRICKKKISVVNDIVDICLKVERVLSLEHQHAHTWWLMIEPREPFHLNFTAVFMSLSQK